MSMELLSILQCTGGGICYLGVTLLYPYLFMRKTLARYRLPARLMAAFMIGNFYVQVLVFSLEFCHISNRYTLILGSLAPALLRLMRLMRGHWRKTAEALSVFALHILEGETGWKLLMSRIRKRARDGIRGLRRRFRWVYLIEFTLTFGVTGLFFFYYGVSLLSSFGYGASDMPVHNYWINGLCDNKLFIDGIYPEGFHWTMYYIHEVFGFPVYVLLRTFWLVRTWLIYMLLLLFLKEVCKSRFVPYLGPAVYCAVDLFNGIVFSRYYSALPQEYAMLFILPSVYFALAFFRDRHGEKKEEGKKAWQLTSTWDLVLFAISLSMTFSVHFYATMVVAFLCIGIGMAYCFRLWKWDYLWKIVAAGIAGLMLAIAPMGICFAMGTPLQGSLYWGMSFFIGGDEEETEEEIETAGEGTEIGGAAEGGAENIGAGGTETTGDTENERMEIVGGTETAEGTETAGKTGTENNEEGTGGEDGFLGVFQQKAAAFPGYLKTYLNAYVAKEGQYGEYFADSILAVLIMGLLFYILREPDYAAVFVTLGVGLALAGVVLCSYALGIPALMDPARINIFMAYLFPATWCLTLDGAISLVTRWWKKEWLLQVCSFLGTGASLAFAVHSCGIITPRITRSNLETNEAITCVSNILREDKETWTIVSMNDELRMTEEYGWHYETIDFLREMENNPDAELTVPTKTVYFFIEKWPLNYAGSGGGDKPVSEEGAEKNLPAGNGLDTYQGENRWILMSKMYYWAEAFDRLYPDEMEVYYEDDVFLCYRVRQNEYSLYNFAIDYGFNTREG